MVYHGTKSSFNAFDRDRIEVDDAFFFTSDPQNAAEYAGAFGNLQGDGGNIMPVFLNIKGVNQYSNKEWLNGEGKEPAGYDSTEGGVIRDQDGGDTYLVVSPAQIKSATGNTGAFSPDNPDIRYSSQQQSALTSSIADAKTELKRLGLDKEAVIKFVDSIANGKADCLVQPHNI